jgi:hypothetical protein
MQGPSPPPPGQSQRWSTEIRNDIQHTTRRSCGRLMYPASLDLQRILTLRWISTPLSWLGLCDILGSLWSCSSKWIVCGTSLPPTGLSFHVHRNTERERDFTQYFTTGWNTTVCHHSSNICDLSPQEKGNQWRTNTTVNTTHIYVDLFSLLYF